MSMQGLQRAQQLLNVIGQQFPSIAQVATMIGPPTEPPKISKEGISLPTPDSA